MNPPTHTTCKCCKKATPLTYLLGGAKPLVKFTCRNRNCPKKGFTYIIG